MEVPDSIRSLRRSTGLSQAKFGRRVGVTERAVQHWEKGTRDPTAGSLIKIARAFRLRIRLDKNGMVWSGGH